MKKITLLIVFALVASSAFSQFTFGPKIGYNSAKLSLDRSNITSDLKNNFQFGAFIRIGTQIYVQPEINWVTQGSIFKTPEGSNLPNFEQEIKLNTIQLPLLIGVKVIDLKLFNLRAFGGPTASIVTSKDISNKLSTLFEPISDANLEDLIWSFQVGAGIDIIKFTLDIRYNFGINKVIESVAIEGQDVEFSSKLNGFNVTLGWNLF